MLALASWKWHQHHRNVFYLLHSVTQSSESTTEQQTAYIWQQWTTGLYFGSINSHSTIWQFHQRAYTERANTRAPISWPWGLAVIKHFGSVNHQYCMTKAWQSLTKDLMNQLPPEAWEVGAPVSALSVQARWFHWHNYSRARYSVYKKLSSIHSIMASNRWWHGTHPCFTLFLFGLSRLSTRKTETFQHKLVFWIYWLHPLASAEGWSLHFHCRFLHRQTSNHILKTLQLSNESGWIQSLKPWSKRGT